MYAEVAGVSANKMPGLVQKLLESIVERESIIGLETETPPEALLQAIARANRRLGSLNASLETQARAGRRRELIARHTAAFLDHHDCASPVETTLKAVTESAISLWNQPRMGVVWRSSGEHAWRFMQVTRDHSDFVTRTRVLPPMNQSLKDLLGQHGCTGVAVSVAIPSLVSCLDSGTAPDKLRLFPLVLEHEVEAVIAHQADLAGWNERTELGPMRSVWASAIRVAVAMERSRELEDDLASANRALAETQSELAERVSMARLGEMTAGAAHEMNNPLAVISGRAQLLRTSLKDSELSGCASAIAEAAADLSALISDLNDLARMDEPKLAVSDPQQIVRDAVVRAGKTRGDTIDASIEVSEGIGPISTDRELLVQALSELIMNAHEAGSPEKVSVRVHAGPEDGRLYFRVEDRGCGLSERAQRHAFDPFFSEKPAGRQRGMGLAKARRGIELLGGRIWIEARQGGGAVASIAFDQDHLLASAA
jgi:signal transduction histidine kinase